MSPRRPAWLWLGAILVVGTLLRMWVWHDHWIDPDEGAHLMDASFALRGMVPYVDYWPREIVYGYLLAALVRLVGPDYGLVRLGVLLVEPLVATLTFLIARRLFDARVALLAAATCFLFPLAVRSSGIVHTEPVAVLSACGVAYLLLRHLEPGGSWATLLLAGMLITAGIYVRDSGVSIGVATAITLTLCTWRRPGLLLRRYAVVLAGVVLTCAAVSLPYNRLLTPERWWRTHLNPLYVLVRHVQPVLSGAVAESAPAATQGAVGIFPPHPQAWSVTWHGYAKTLIVLSPLLIAWAVGGVLLLALRRRQQASARLELAGALLYPWVASLGAAYTYWTVYRGFFPEYSVELLPPLAIVFAYLLPEFLARWESGRLLGWVLAVLAVGALTIDVAFSPGTARVPWFVYVAIPPLLLGRAWTAAHRRERWWPAAAAVGVALLFVPLDVPFALDHGLKLLVALGLVAGGWLAVRRRPARDGLRPSLPGYLVLVSLGAAAGVSLDVASHSQSLRFEGVWPPRVVQEIADSLRRRGQQTDEVVSGAVIWEFHAGLQPFQRITHPLKFEFGITAGESAALTERLRTDPPRFVVFDGYTERTYDAVLPVLSDVVRDRYQLVVSVPGGVYPVRLYQLRTAQPAP